MFQNRLLPAIVAASLLLTLHVLAEPIPDQQAIFPSGFNPPAGYTPPPGVMNGALSTSSTTSSTNSRSFTVPAPQSLALTSTLNGGTAVPSFWKASWPGFHPFNTVTTFRLIAMLVGLDLVASDVQGMCTPPTGIDMERIIYGQIMNGLQNGAFPAGKDCEDTTIGGSTNFWTNVYYMNGGIGGATARLRRAAAQKNKEEGKVARRKAVLEVMRQKYSFLRAFTINDSDLTAMEFDIDSLNEREKRDYEEFLREVDDVALYHGQWRELIYEHLQFKTVYDGVELNEEPTKRCRLANPGAGEDTVDIRDPLADILTGYVLDRLTVLTERLFCGWSKSTLFEQVYQKAKDEILFGMFILMFDNNRPMEAFFSCDRECNNVLVSHYVHCDNVGALFPPGNKYHGMTDLASD